jgi:hypothetical protein
MTCDSKINLYTCKILLASIGTLSQTFKNHIHCNGCLKVMRSECLWRFLSKNDNSGGKIHEASEGVEYNFYFTEYDFLSCMITCSDFYPLSNQINLFMVINIWGIINRIRSLAHCVTNISFLWMRDLDVTASKLINMQFVGCV